jgi:hypothetical protein
VLTEVTEYVFLIVETFVTVALGVVVVVRVDVGRVVTAKTVFEVILRHEQAEEIRLAGMADAVKQAGGAIVARFSKSRFPGAVVDTDAELVVIVEVETVVVTLVVIDNKVLELVVRTVKVVLVVDGIDVVVEVRTEDVDMTMIVLVVLGVTVLV